jgi:hypothetical protein
VSAVASGLSFEVLRFAAAPVSAEVVLLEVEGRFRADPRRRLGVPRLVVEQADRSHEIAPAAADEALAAPDGTLWRASFAVALELLDDGEFSLAVGRELLLGLPDPDFGGGADDREVRLAREANALRRTTDEARAAAAAALASAGSEREARETAEAEMAEARLARDDHARRASSLDDELAQLRLAHAAELVGRDEQLATALTERDQAAAQAADERAMVLETEIAEARRALRNARADVESLQRDVERERERAEAAEAALPRGRVTELDGEPVEGEPLDDRPTTKIDATTTDDADAAARDDAAAGEEALAAARAEADEPRDEDVTEVATIDQPETTTLESTAPIEQTAAIEADPGESVRVIGARRPRRSGEGTPAEAAPGTAAIGARHIEPGQTHRSAIEAWITRSLAFAALTVVIVAILLVLKPF